MVIEKFSHFLLLKESNSYKIPGVETLDGGGYDLKVFDITDSEHEPGKILVSKKDGSLVLSYLNGSNKLSDTLEIPQESAEVITDGENRISKVILDPYKKWILSSENRNSVEDFLENFSSHISRSDVDESDAVKDDLEIILSVLGVPLNVSEIKRGSDNKTWEATLDGGHLAEIRKRSDDDLMGSLKIYQDENDTLPCININETPNGGMTTFFIKGEDPVEIEEPIGLSSLKEKSPYHTYLINKCLNRESKQDKERFTEYFLNDLKNHTREYRNSTDPVLIKSGQDKEDNIKKMMKVLSTFLPKSEVQDLYLKNLNR